ncbi:MAG: M15 family metallopeptidase [Cyanobacteria bacterium P01_D01_bin.105]
MSNSPHTPVSPSDRFSDDPLSGKLSGDILSGDIPAARRQSADIPASEIERVSARPIQGKRSRSGLLIGGSLLAGVAGVGLWHWHPVGLALNPEALALSEVKQVWQKAVTATGLGDSPNPVTVSETATPPPAETASAIEQSPQADQSPQAKQSPQEDTLLNHRSYDEVPAESLVPLNPNSLLKLQPAAQQAVNEMLAKAKSEGIQLGVISAFRTLEDQDYLYFQLKAERGQSARTRAEVSAPPGYSEHHTGYAVDFIDESKPDTQLQPSFEKTPAYRWLAKNAAFFNFEMSFPKNATSGVSYEPWHWRYVGNQESLELFYKD